jgi:PDDEXK-like domain of unknown function (DUF3799)
MSDMKQLAGGDRTELLSMDWEDYKAFPAMNGSVLTEGRRSLRHLRYAWEHGRKDTDAMRYGRLVHCLLLEPSEVANRYRAWEGARRGNDYKDFVVVAEQDGAEVIKQEGQYSLDAAIEASQWFLKTPRVRELIAAGQAEQTVLGVECGLQCKGRLDWVSTSQHILTDLKNSTVIEPRDFGRAFYKYGYDIKLGLYQRWLNRGTNDQWPVEVIVLESQPPYDVAIYPIADAILDRGVEKALQIMQSVAEAIESDKWPGVGGDDGLLGLEVPFWEMEEEMEEFKG